MREVRGRALGPEWETAVEWGRRGAVEDLSQWHLIMAGGPGQGEDAVAGESGCERGLCGHREESPPTREPSSAGRAAEEGGSTPGFLLGKSSDELERCVANLLPMGVDST